MTEAEAAYDAVLFDFGGVLSDSPFEAFARYEAEQGLPAGFIRSLNAANHHDNAWARFERDEVDFDEFCALFEAEAIAAGGRVEGAALFATFTGELRPAMVDAVRRCHERYKTALLTNNFVTPLATGERGESLRPVLELFDVVVESSVVGIRKPDPRFYELACDLLGVSPARAVFLDDLGVNLKPARAMGMTTIKVTGTDDALAQLEAVLGIGLPVGGA